MSFYEETKKTINNIIFFNKKKNYLFIIISGLSGSIPVFFPLITQTYLHQIYPKEDTTLLITFGASLITFFIIKTLIDSKLKKYENKLLLKIEKRLFEKIFEKKLKKINLKSYDNKKADEIFDLWFFNIPKYMLFIRKVLWNSYLSGTRIIILLLLMFFFSSKLLIYSLWFFPIIIIYTYFFQKKISERRIFFKDMFASTKVKRARWVDFFKKIREEQMSEKEITKQFRRTLQTGFDRDLFSRNLFIDLNQWLRTSITFYRIIFLTYFGYFIITQHLFISDLIVGLLYITLLGRNINQLTESLTWWAIVKGSTKKINRELAR